MITVEELRHVLDPQTLLDLTDDTDAGTEDAGIISSATDLADIEIRNRLSLDVPGDTELPDTYRDIWITLTVERLFERRRDSVPTLWQQRAARARELLAIMNDNEQTVAETASSTSNRPCSTREPEDRAHQPDSLKRY